LLANEFHLQRRRPDRPQRFNPHSPLLANEFMDRLGITWLRDLFQSTFAIAGE